MTIQKIIFKSLRRIFRQQQTAIYNEYVDLYDETANDYIYKQLSTGKPMMISKFGSIELSALVCYHVHKNGIGIKEYWDAIHERISIDKKNAIAHICRNAGFFPNDIKMGEKFYERVVSDMKMIDVLGSYQYKERYLFNFINALRVNLNGYYAPFLWEHPWTKWLEGKKVLVVHPFTESIKYQYEHNRERLFVNSNVLPKFKELILIKAVQSIAEAKEGLPFSNWFEALKFMEDEIDKHDYDIALIGCGAYGMSLAAHCKRMGKQAIHLAGWTQMLFGIYGNRWLNDQVEYSKYINEYWIRPLPEEKPKGAEKIENGCYW